jgi:hypothetical protein
MIPDNNYDVGDGKLVDVVRLNDHGMLSNNTEIVIDSTDHFDLIHTICGKKKELRLDIDYVDTDMCKYKKIWMETRCVYCNEPWRRWRKIVLDFNKGEYKKRKGQ